MPCPALPAAQPNPRELLQGCAISTPLLFILVLAAPLERKLFCSFLELQKCFNLKTAVVHNLINMN